MGPFYFKTTLHQVILLGRRARNIPQLLDGIKSVPDSSIYHHTHHFLQQHHYLSPEPTNDFAYWVTNVLNTDDVGEALFSVNVVEFGTMGELRQALVDAIATHHSPEAKTHDAPHGEEFHFMDARTFVLNTPYVAGTLKEFLDVVRHIGIASLYFHIFDAKLRLEQGENDFSRWLRDAGFESLAAEIVHLDPYSYTLEGLRKTILALGDKYD
jgi:hypothetical protein